MIGNHSEGVIVTAVYRHCGIVGLRWFGRVYFPLLLGCLVTLGIAVVWATPFLPSPQRVVTQVASGALLLVGVFLVCRMWAAFQRELSNLDGLLHHSIDDIAGEDGSICFLGFKVIPCTQGLAFSRSALVRTAVNSLRMHRRPRILLLGRR
ncbi:hypothetical protein FF011L_09680 [Roseimaritima multifibrata]|uniref:Uncharacterized protein n=1 Tax=Roseimaritima multifibrata TaxID=1930274 RepID=A0A517MBJ8_9BACT|nr:hypothetical protein FF011L_09680 [Roseimaritima multifibrata]